MSSEVKENNKEVEVLEKVKKRDLLKTVTEEAMETRRLMRNASIMFSIVITLIAVIVAIDARSYYNRAVDKTNDKLDTIVDRLNGTNDKLDVIRNSSTSESSYQLFVDTLYGDYDNEYYDKNNNEFYCDPDCKIPVIGEVRFSSIHTTTTWNSEGNLIKCYRLTNGKICYIPNKEHVSLRDTSWIW